MPVITGTGSDDTLDGTTWADLIRGLGGVDSLRGLGGDDELQGGDGNDYLSGGDDNDLLHGGDGDDQLSGDAGDDVLYGGEGNDYLSELIYGGSDRLYGEGGNDVLRHQSSSSTTPSHVVMDGGSGDDVIEQSSFFTSGTVTILGDSGHDQIRSTGGGSVSIDAGADGDLVRLSTVGGAYNIPVSDYLVTLGSGSDLLVLDSFQTYALSGDKVIVTDFVSGDAGDAISLVDFLAFKTDNWAYDTNPLSAGYLRLVQRGADTVLQLDRDGAGSYHSFGDVVILQNVDALTLTALNLGGYSPAGAAPAVEIIGTAAADFRSATGEDDILRGFGGNDVLFGGAGNDLIEGGDGDDELNGEFGNDQVYGGNGEDKIRDMFGGDDQIYGGAGRDTITVDRQSYRASAANVLIDGGEGNDGIYFSGRREQSGFSGDVATILGGSGDDWISIYSGRSVTIDAGSGEDFITLNGGTTEVVIALGTGADSVQFVGTTTSMPVSSVVITDFEAGDGGDHLYLLGFLGQLVGGAWNPAVNPFLTNYLRLAQSGTDTLLLYDGSGEGQFYSPLIRLSGVAATDLTSSNFNLDFAPAGVISIGGTAGADFLVGTAGNDSLLGFGGDDVLSGGGGNDRFAGGLGNDIYHVDSGDLVFEGAGEGNDAIYASASYTLGAGVLVEILSVDDYGMTGAINLTGNEFGQQIFGNAGNNVLTAGGGADGLYGGLGNDIYFVDSSDVVVEAAGAGLDQVYTSTSFTLGAGVSVEILSVDDYAATSSANLTGNEFGQQIFGNAGNNVLIAGGGADGLYGGLGNDIYFVDSSDVIVEAAGEGFDQVYTSTSFTLGAGVLVEILSVDDYAATSSANLTGNEFGQQIFGNAGNNVLTAGGGADGLYGGLGNDIYFVDSSDVVVEAAGAGLDQVYASTSFTLGAGVSVEILSVDDYAATSSANLTGNEFGQQIFGNAGNNVLNGGGGFDTLYGQGGADSFVFTSALGNGNVDNIVDFAAGQDRILLDHTVFTGLGLGTLSAAAFRIGGAARDADDRILYDPTNGALVFDADGSGASAGILFATVQTGLNPVASDFIVI